MKEKKTEKELKREKLMSRNFMHAGKWYMVYCPKCDLENYAPAVASGTCAWCGYDLNKEENKND